MTTTVNPPAGQVAPATPKPARDRNFRLLWAGEATSKVGSAVTGVAFPLVAVVTLGAGTVATGLLNAMAWLPWLLIGLPAGAWIDRFSRRRTMLAADFLSIAVLLSVPVAAWFGVLSLAQLVVVSFVAGTASMFFSTAYQAFLPAVVAKEHLADANAKLQGTDQVANLAGPGVGGLLTQAVGAVYGLLADVVTFAVSAFCLLRMRVEEPLPSKKERTTRLRDEIGEGLRYVGRDRYLRILALSAAVDNFTLNAMYALTVVFLVRTVEAPAAVVGFVLAADFAGGLLGAMIARRVAARLGTARALLICSIGTAPFALLIPLTQNGFGLVFFVLGILVPSIGMVIGNVVVTGFRQAYCPPRLLGRMYASSRFLQFGVIPLGAVLGGVLGAALGVREALWIITAAGALGKLLRLVGPIRAHRDLPTAPPEDNPELRKEQ
ncbi:MFS transporter [Amycolatopsis magusensis]|uniref:MFS family permease n=1 Tax=Amycolatopsis magusensis TaxID=882444 RepID=A0ABS4PXP6_9PSEU|nr:MFS transporter [Amycolatopsis magusensis]MBP2184201.1 MFS family permease [Amycolatopsis magusensis]